MADSKLELAQRLALAGAIIVIVYHIDEVIKASGGSGYLPIPSPMVRGALFGIPALALSVASFALVWRKTSIIVPMLLLISGGLMTVDGIMIGTKYLSILTMPGPIIGLVYGVTMLSLGVIKAVTTAYVLKQQPPPATQKDNQ